MVPSLTYFPVVTGVHQGCVLCTGPHTFQHLYGLYSREDVGEIKLRCIVWECQVPDLDFVDDAVIFAETGYPFWGPQGAE